VAATMDIANRSYSLTINNGTPVVKTGITSFSESVYTPAPHSAPESVGANLTSASNMSRFVGVIDEVKVYNRALTANEIAALYNRGNDHGISFQRIENGASADTFTFSNGDTVRAVFSLKNHDTADKQYYLLLAVYQGSMLKEMRLAAVDLPGGTQAGVQAATDWVTVGSGGNYTVKGYIWNRQSLSPVNYVKLVLRLD
jgi:hypothetical protein